MSTEVKTHRRTLTCDTHGDKSAENVCGECGTTLCGDCAESVHDATFVHFESTGLKKLGAAFLLVVGAPVLFYGVAPGLLPEVRRAIVPGQLIKLNPPVTLSAIVLGLALLPPIWYRSGSSVFDAELLVRRGNERTVCEDCHEAKKAQTRLYYAVTAVGAVIALLGVFLVVSGSVILLPVVAIGVGVYLLRDEAVVALSDSGA